MTRPVDEDEVRSALRDPSLQLPDDLVDLGAVHATARTRQRRRISLAAGSALVVAAALGLFVTQPWEDAAPVIPDASGIVTPTPTGPPSSPTPSPSESKAPVVVDAPVAGVTAINDQTWWVLLGTNQRCPAGSCPVSLLRTGDGGATFSQISASGGRQDVPAGTTTIRFLSKDLGWALSPHAPAGDQLWFTDDGGRAWSSSMIGYTVVELEAGGGLAWVTVEDGDRLGVLPLDLTDFSLRAPAWLGRTMGPEPALTVQRGEAVVLWYDSAGSHTSLVSAQGTITQRTNPCGADLGSGSISAALDVIAVSCHTGTVDQPYASDDGGRTWSPLTLIAGEPAQRYVVGAIEPGLVAVGGESGRLTLARPVDWIPSTARRAKVAQEDPWSYLGFTDPDHGFGINTTALFRTTDGGRTWAKVTVG